MHRSWMYASLFAWMVSFGCGGTAATAAPATSVARTPPNTPQAGTGTHALSVQARRPHFVSPTSYAAFIRAELALAADNPQRAVREYERALADVELDVYLLCRYAVALHRAGQAEAASHILDEASRYAPMAGLPWLTRGELALSADDKRTALWAYQQAVALQPAALQPSRRLAYTLEQLGAHERAEAIWLALAAHNPTRAIDHLHAELQLALHSGETEQAERRLLQLAALGEASPEERTTVAEHLLQRGRPVEAVQWLAPLVTNRQNAPLKLAAFRAAGDDDALRALLLEFPSDWLGAPPVVAAALLHLGEANRALALLEAAQKLTSENAADTQQLLAQLSSTAQLQLHGPAAALESLEAVPNGTFATSRGRALVRDLLAGAGLSALAAHALPPEAEQQTEPVWPPPVTDNPAPAQTAAAPQLPK